MVAFVRPPTSDEMQYTGDVIHGRRTLDVKVFIVFAVLGALLGLAIGIAEAAANEKAIDFGFTLISTGVCAVALAIFAMLIMGTIRSLQAACRVWLPARVMVAIALVAFVLRVLDAVQFILVMGPGAIFTQLIVGGIGLIFALLFLNIGVRIAFLVYCMVTGRDEDAIMTQAIAAKDTKATDDGENDRESSPTSSED